MKFFPLIFLSIFFIIQDAQARISTDSSQPKKEFSISVEDEIRDLLTDQKKYERNKNGCGVAAAGCVALTVVAVAIGKDLKYATLPFSGALATASFALWNWWSEGRSYRQAYALANEHNIEIKSHDDSQKLEQINK